MVDFYFTEELEASKYNFIDNGWLPLHKRKRFTDIDTDITIYHLIYSYMISDNALPKCIDSYRPDVKETHRIVDSTDFFGSDVVTLVTLKDFHLAGYNRIKYVDVAEELINFLSLMEEVSSKQDREYFYIDDNGTKESVIKVTEDEVLIKQLYLNKYLIHKEMHLCTYFYFDAETKLRNPAISEIRPTEGRGAGVEIKTDTYIHNNLIRPEFMNQLYQSWQQGKSIIKYTELSDIDPISTVEFIVGLDKRTGAHIKKSCRCDEEDYYTMIYFDKKVMDRYYSDARCEVTPTRLSSEFYSMRFDNDNTDFVGVYLKDLNSLPVKEILYWSSFNIAPNERTKPSTSFDLTMHQGCWNAPLEQVDLVFKDRFSEFNEKWFQSYKWLLFKPLNELQKSSLTRLCIPQSCSKVQFDTQIESLALILVDSINVEELRKITESTEKDKAIDILAKYLSNFKATSTEIIAYLRCLQTLRSKITAAHRYSKSSLLNKSLAYFSINPDLSNLQDGIKQVFTKAIAILDELDDLLTKQ